MNMKQAVVVCSVCGLAGLILIGELGEIYEGKIVKEHSHAHTDYQHVGNSAYLVSGTSASSAAMTTGTNGLSFRVSL